MNKIIFIALFIVSIHTVFSQVSSGDIPSQDKNNNTSSNNTQNDDTFYYNSVSRLNIGFGNSNFEGVSTIGVGYFGDFAFSKTGKGNFELEVGTTTLITSIDIAGASESSSAYFISGALKYGYFLTNDLKISSGAGYYFGLTGSSANDIFYSATLDYFLSKSFGLNVRYDELLGFNFGLSFIL